MTLPSGSAGANNSNSAVGGSLDSSSDRVQQKQTGSHDSKPVTTRDGQTIVGKAREPGSSQPVQRSILDRHAQHNDQLDPEGLESLPSADHVAVDMDDILDQQLEQVHGKSTPQPPVYPPVGDEGKKPPPEDHPTPPPSGGATPEKPKPAPDGSQPVSAGGKTNVQITSTEEVDTEAQKIEETEKGLAKKLSFLDKIPHKKNIAFMGVGAVLCAVGLGTFPAGLIVASIGMMFIAVSTAYLLHDANAPDDGAPTPPPPPENKKKEEDEGKKPEETPDSKPSVPSDFIALENPEFQQAARSTVGDDEARRLEELKKKANLTPPQIHDLVNELVTTESELPLSQRVANAVAPLMVEAGFDPRQPESWTATNAMIATLEKALTDPDATKEQVVQSMVAATTALLEMLDKSKVADLLKLRESVVAMASLPLSSNAVSAMQGMVQAIDDRILVLSAKVEVDASHLAPKEPFKGARKGGATSVDRGERLGLGPEDHLNITNSTNKRHYFLLKAELAAQVGQGFTEQDANNLLIAAYSILNSSEEALAGAVFIDQLKKDPAYLASPARQAAIEEIVESKYQHRFKK